MMGDLSEAYLDGVVRNAIAKSRPPSNATDCQVSLHGARTAAAPRAPPTGPGGSPAPPRRRTKPGPTAGLSPVFAAREFCALLVDDGRDAQLDDADLPVAAAALEAFSPLQKACLRAAAGLRGVRAKAGGPAAVAHVVAADPEHVDALLAAAACCPAVGPSAAVDGSLPLAKTYLRSGDAVRGLAPPQRSDDYAAVMLAGPFGLVAESLSPGPNPLLSAVRGSAWFGRFLELCARLAGDAVETPAQAALAVAAARALEALLLFVPGDALAAEVRAALDRDAGAAAAVAAARGAGSAERSRLLRSVADVLLAPKRPTLTRCFRCGELAAASCARCKGVAFCGRACQRAVWGVHRQFCRAPG